MYPNIYIEQKVKEIPHSICPLLKMVIIIPRGKMVKLQRNPFGVLLRKFPPGPGFLKSREWRIVIPSCGIIESAV
jgi:hypothetical protein